MSHVHTPRSTDRRPQPRRALRPALAGMALAPVLLALTPGSALAAPGDLAAGADIASRATAVAAPSVAFVHTEATGYALTHEGTRIGPITVTWDCSAAVVGADGVIATNGECVDTAEGSILSDEVLYQASGIAADSGEWTLSDGTPASQDVLLQDAEEAWVVEGTAAGSPLVPDVTVTLPGRGDVPGEVLVVTDFGGGNTAVLDVAAEGLPVLEIATEQPAAGDQVVAVGLAAAGDARTADVTSRTGTVVSAPQGVGAESFDVDLELTGAMGGGPLVDAEGRLLGLTDFTTSDTPPTTLVRPASVVQDLLPASADIGLADADRSFRDAVAAQLSGDPAAAVELFDAVLAEVSDHPTAGDLRAEAVSAATSAAAAAAAADASSVPGTAGGVDRSVVLVAVAAGLMLLGGGAAVALTRRSRRPVPPPVPAGQWIPADRSMPVQPGMDPSGMAVTGAAPEWAVRRSA
jgi:hypothetical protein